MNSTATPSPELIKRVLTQIASDAATLAAITERAISRAELTDAVDDLVVAQMFAERMGALADAGLERFERIGGEFTDWALGRWHR